MILESVRLLNINLASGLRLFNLDFLLDFVSWPVTRCHFDRSSLYIGVSNRQRVDPHHRLALILYGRTRFQLRTFSIFDRDDHICYLKIIRDFDANSISDSACVGFQTNVMDLRRNHPILHGNRVRIG